MVMNGKQQSMTGVKVSDVKNAMLKERNNRSEYYSKVAWPLIAFSILCGSMPMYLCVTAAELCCKSRWTRAISNPFAL